MTPHEREAARAAGTTAPVTALPAPGRDPWWNHNTHYHRLVPRVAPPPWARALDVGCGEGLLTRRLAPVAGDVVVGVDPDAAAVDRARELADHPRLRYVVGDVLTADVGGPFDLVTCVATLHHLPLEAGLARLRGLVAPGGTLLVVGLARAATALDLAVSAAGVVPSAWARRTRGHWEPDVALAEPTTSLGEIAAAARDALPGAVIRRHLYWRYSLTWRAPG